jgi:GNAT superfamily N-acetyltransferase
VNGPAPTDESAIVERCHRSLVDGGWELSRTFGHPRREDWPEGVALRSDLPSDLVNLLYVERPPVSVDDLLRRATAFFGRGTPWRMIVRQSAEGAVRASAPRTHLIARESQPGMWLHPLPPTPQPPASLRIERVTTERQLVDFREAVALSFGIPRFVGRHTFPSVPSGSGPRPTAFLVGYGPEGRPVASSAVVVVEGVAGVYMVGTAPSARRRGYGAALTWAAIDAGRAAGAEVAALNATEMGRPVYAQMGFRIFDPYAEWSLPISGWARFRATLAILGLAFRRANQTPAPG